MSKITRNTSGSFKDGDHNWLYVEGDIYVNENEVAIVLKNGVLKKLALSSDIVPISDEQQKINEDFEKRIKALETPAT